MKNNIKVQALLSINPSFNIDFIDNRIYSQPNEPNYRKQIKTNQQGARKSLEGSKSLKRQINSLELKREQSSRELQNRSVFKVRTKSFSNSKLQAVVYKKLSNYQNEITIDCKKPGNCYRIRSYGKWFNEN